MFRTYLLSFAQTPLRLWRYAQRHPYEFVGYGSLLLLSAIFARWLVTMAAAVAVLAGIYWVFRGNDKGLN